MKKYFTPSLFALLIFSPFNVTSDEPAATPAATEQHHEIAAPAEPAPAEGEIRDFYSEFLHMLVVLGVVLGVLFALSWILKRMQSAKIYGGNKDSLIKVLESRHISQKSAIHFIEVLNKGIIVGESHLGLVRLAEFPLDSDEEEEETKDKGN